MSQKLALTLGILLLLSQVALLGFLYFEYAFRSSGSYFGRLPDNTEFELDWIPRPAVSTKALLNWATLAATASYTLDFVNYEKNLADLKVYFTTDGYQNFLAALAESNTLSTLIEKKLVISAVAVGPAIVIAEDEVLGRHIWKIEVPITVTYLSASAEERRRKLVTLVVSEVPTTQAPTGIGIAQYLTTDLSLEI